MSPTLHLLCGKIAAGKSTLASRLARSEGAVLIAEDDWLSALFDEDITSGSDYLRCAAKLRRIMQSHVASLLSAGVSVVLDFPANTVDSRVWMRDVIRMTGARHRMHVLTPPDSVCLERLRRRNQQGDHAFAATEAQFRQFSRHFVPPLPEEGFELVHYTDPDPRC